MRPVNRRSVRGNALRPFALPAGILAVFIGTGIGLVILSQSVGGSDAPPPAPPFVTPVSSSVSALDVKQRDGDVVTLIRQKAEAADERKLTITTGLRIERMTPITTADVRVGEWLTAVGIPNQVKNFAVRALVLLPGGGTPASDGFVRSAGGFVGHESSQSQDDRPILGGTVERIEGSTIVLTTVAGTVNVRAEAGTPIFRLEPGSANDVGEGARLAGTFGESDPVSVLVQRPAGR